MKIDDLVANLKRNAQEQDRIMTEQIQNITKQHLVSYNELLQSNLKATQNIINDHQTSLQQDLKRLSINKIATGAVLGLMVACLLGLGLANLWLYIQYQNTAKELKQIELNIQKTPIQTRALAKIQIGQNKDGSIWIQPKNPKKSAVGRDHNNNPLITLD